MAGGASPGDPTDCGPDFPAPRTPDQVVADNVRKHRMIRDLTQRELADRMGSLGHPWTSNVVGGVERRRNERSRARGVSTNELIAVALALGVSVVDLLDPTGPDGLAEVGLACGKNMTLDPGTASSWIRGANRIRITGDHAGHSTVAATPHQSPASEHDRYGCETNHGGLDG